MKRVTPEKVNVFKGFRAFEKSRSESRLHAPKPSAIPLGDTPEYEIAVLALPVLLPIIIADFCGKVNDFWGKIYRRRLPASAASAAGLRGVRCRSPRYSRACALFAVCILFMKSGRWDCCLQGVVRNISFAARRGPSLGSFGLVSCGKM